jgi:hypothetical protein
MQLSRTAIVLAVSTTRADNFELRTRVELESTWQPIRWVSAGAVGLCSHYSSSNLDDGVTHSSYGVSIYDLWLGARLYVHPHWRVFVGGTLWKQWEREFQTITHQSEWLRNSSAELVIGVNLRRVDNNLISIAATHTSYTQFDIESVEVWSVTFGITHCWTHCW